LIATIAVSCGIIFFCLGFIYGYGVVFNIGFSIGLIVANIPEGLLITITICMAKAAKQMWKRMVLVKNLQSVETLGSTSCICSDKTGTLT
jgi:sodium/potassium-transporting ATPase subunit alpha